MIKVKEILMNKYLPPLLCFPFVLDQVARLKNFRISVFTD